MGGGSVQVFVLARLVSPRCVVGVRLFVFVSCTFQHIKRNAETEGQGTLKVAVAEEELRVVRDCSQEGTSLLATSSNTLGLLLVRQNTFPHLC